MAGSSCSQHQSLLLKFTLRHQNYQHPMLICIWHSGAAGINRSCSCFSISSSVLRPILTSLLKECWFLSLLLVLHIHDAFLFVQSRRMCSSNWSIFKPTEAVLTDFHQTSYLVPFEWFRLVSGTKNMGIFDEIKWATKMVYEIVPIWLGRVSSPENILNNQGPFFHCSNEAIPLPRYIILLSTSFLAVDVSLRNHLGKTMKTINK